MNVFDKLAPFIQDYIYEHEWEELKAIQAAACDVIFHTEENLLLAAPTASGKTEAAFLPILTQLYNKPPGSVGVLYVAPLKALINDQFVRIEELLCEADIPVTKWHGDASQAQKNQLIKNPKGILQITPESLEAMLMKRKQDVLSLFSDLRFIVIDELHSFLSEDRGIQLSAILQRIQLLTENIPRRVGLSATIGNAAGAQEWLNAGTGRTCAVPEAAGRGRARILLDHFYTLPEKQDTKEKSWQAYYQFLYQLTRGKKCIIFANSRSEVERNIVNLKELAAKRKERDVFFVHHGSISASNREYAEEQMKSSSLPFVTGATLTLELGIDLGDLDRIIQTGCPHSVSSLAQRLGRSGRRNGVSEMSFVFNEERPQAGAAWHQSMNWLLVKCVALIELYREGWLEPAAAEKYPFSMLFHQTLSFLYSHGEASPGFLAQTILGLSIFQHITRDDYRLLLQSMLAAGQLERTVSGGLLIAEQGERLTNHYDFYMVFETSAEYAVRDKTHEIGTLNDPMPPNSTFVLAGHTWTVIELDKEKRVMYVEGAKGKPPTVWRSPGSGFEHTRVLQKMKAVIAGRASYPYLTENAAERLAEMRETMRQAGALTADCFTMAPNSCAFFPWLGTRAQNALSFALMKKLPGCAVVNEWPMLIVKGVSEESLRRTLNKLKVSALTLADLALPGETMPPIGKYGAYVPDILLRKQFADKYIDIDEMQSEWAIQC